MTFTKDSGLVKVWVRLVQNGTYTREQNRKAAQPPKLPEADPASGSFPEYPRRD